jgi:DNA mismatch repair protein MutL
LGTIHLLDEQTANQIAAGEVVERPASVVKELVENSLDAGSKRVIVEVEGGGRDLIRVTDDGTGMSPEDARLCLQRHATSKIRSADDLLAVQTMGFRGEAIPSIASVSRFELITREANAVGGWRLYIEGGTIQEEGPVGCPAGTRITVQDLFYNLPARLKYLKTNATEMGQISDMLTRLALSHTGAAVRFHSGPVQVFATPGTGDLMGAVSALLGREVGKELLPVDYREGAYHIYGFVGRPGIARAGRSHQYLFVNRRAIRTTNLRYALEEAYANLLPNGRYPVCVLFFDLPPQEVDVNVHPAKAEVRFAREREVKSAVYKAVRQALGAHLLIPGTTVSTDGEIAIPDRAAENAASAKGDGAAGWLPPGASRPGQGGGRAPLPPWQGPGQVSFRLETGHPNGSVHEKGPVYALPEGGIQIALSNRAAPVGGERTSAVAEMPISTSSPGALIRSLRPLGQIHRSYIVCDGPEGLYVMDQHAAHERVFFERFMHAAEAAAADVQPLLFPITLDLTAAQMALWQEHADLFAESGFLTEPFGGRTLLIQGVPSGVSEAHTARLVCDFLDRMLEQSAPHTASVMERRRRTMAAMAACKAAIKAKDALQPEDVVSLLQDLAACESPTTCPHGRPTLFCIGLGELEKRFKR